MTTPFTKRLRSPRAQSLRPGIPTPRHQRVAGSRDAVRIADEVEQSLVR